MKLPPRRRGRPSKADVAAREAAKQAEAQSHKETPDGKSEAFLDEALARPFQKRKGVLQADEETLRTIFELAKLLCTQKEIAGVLGVSDRTLSKFLNEVPEAHDAWEDGQSHGKISLRRKQFGLADKNAPAAIFLGKNMLGQKDVVHTNTTVNREAKELSEDELMDLIERSQMSGQPAARGSKVLN